MDFDPELIEPSTLTIAEGDDSEPVAESLEFRPESAESGQRLDRYLAGRLPEFSRRFLQQLIASSNVRVDGIPRRQTFKVASGQLITIVIPRIAEFEILPQPIPLVVVYEDDDILVIDKPAGMVVHPAAGHPDGTVINAVLFHRPDIWINGSTRPGIVHRLDKDTSGLMVIATSARGQHLLLRQWSERSIEKGYIGLVRGLVEPNAGTIDAPIGRDPKDRLRMAVVASGRPALTNFDVARRFSEASLLDISIETGRTHQIRVHLAYISHAVVGDPVYNRHTDKFGGRTPLVPRQFLHASRLGLNLADGQRAVFESQLPADLAKCLSEMESESARNQA
jgi:23S rRNA pseudouridine1911/1915/1917 synthase